MPGVNEPTRTEVEWVIQAGTGSSWLRLLSGEGSKVRELSKVVIGTVELDCVHADQLSVQDLK